MKPNKPSFVLFRSTTSANRCEYIGSLVIDGRCYAIEADVAEHDKGDGTKGKHFAGRILGGQEVIRSLLRGAKAQGNVPPDLVTLMEAMPFDDPLPPLEQSSASA